MLINLILFLILLTIMGSSEQVFADHMTASVSIPQGTSVPGCETYNECFIPYDVTVDVGSVVTWSNNDVVSHTVTSGSAADGPSGDFDSRLFKAGTTFSHTFEAEGEFPYHCMVHPWREGIVSVVDDPNFPGPPPITVKTNSNHYHEGDVIYVSGEVSEILFGYDVSLMGIAPDGNIVSIDHVMVGSDKKFGAKLAAGTSRMMDDGVYTIQVLYGTKNRTAETTFTFTGSTSDVPLDVTTPKILQPKDIVIDAKSLPSWVKNVAELWCADKIDDSAFVEGIQYLIDNDIIVVSVTSSSGSYLQEVPQWVKNNTCWWSAGMITDEDFAAGIEYLIKEGIIIV